MKECFVPWMVLLLCIVVGVAGFGCDDDEDSTTTSTNAVGDESTVEAPQTLASDTKTVVAAGPAVNSGAVTAPGAGTIVAVVSWSEAAQLTVYFKKSGPANFGWVQGDSPLTSIVDPVVNGEQCTMYMANSGAVNINASYTITYNPN